MNNLALDTRYKCLMVAFFFPPCGGVALPGSQRVTKFIRNFRQTDVTVLTVDEECYPSLIELDNRMPLPVNGEAIHRTGMHDYFQFFLGIRRFFKRLLNIDCGKDRAETQAKQGVHFLNIDQRKVTLVQVLKDFVHDVCYFPDPACGWIIPAFLKGRKIIKNEKPDVIFATGMPWSGLIIAWMLHKWSGIPLVVDFRDPWVGNPFAQTKGKLLEWLSCVLEAKIVSSAKWVSLNTATLRDDFISRYSLINPERFLVLPNGFDPADYSFLENDGRSGTNKQNRRLELGHAGYLYGKRDPAPLLDAIASLIAKKRLTADDICFHQFGYSHLPYDLEVRYDQLVRTGVLKLEGQLPFRDCLERLAQLDVLVLIQPATKTQVPSKLYDYISLQKTVVTITPLDGALGQLIIENGFGSVYDESDKPEIEECLERLAAHRLSGQTLDIRYPKADSFNIVHITHVLEERLKEAVFCRPRPRKRSPRPQWV